MKKVRLLKMSCIVFVVCVATAITSPAQETFTRLHVFDGDGILPLARLVQGTDGNFYGTTANGGGRKDDGMVFKITPAGKFTTLHGFNGTDGGFPSGLIQATDGNFYGTTESGGQVSNCNRFGCGTVFKITPAGVLTTLYSFAGTDGSSPGGTGALIQATDGNFYGTTALGGTSSNPNCVSGCGTVFQITPAGVLTTLYSFGGADGYLPEAALLQATDGNFYGTTARGGASSTCSGGCGTVFQITPAGALTTLYSFTGGTDGSNPSAALVQATDGNFYGTTARGGASSTCSGGCGTVFQITPAGALTTLYSFAGTDGSSPQGALIQATDGNFYGTTWGGGANGRAGAGPSGGTIFRINAAGTLATLYNFCSQEPYCTDGDAPVAGLVQGTNGNFYGTTANGGSLENMGTVFSLSVGPSPVAFLTTSLNFGSQFINTTSAAKTVTVANIGWVTLGISGITTTGDFAVSSTTCPATLRVGQTCNVSVTFTPTVLGNLTGALTLTDSAPNSPQALPLRGTGMLPATLIPANATYAAQPVGTTSPAKTFTLINNQTVGLTSIAITTSGDFAVSSTTCTSSLSAKAKCTISVTFTPTTTGTGKGQLSVSDSANNSPQTAALSGVGVEPATLTPSSATYGPQTVGTTTPAKAFTLTNNQTVALNNIAISTGGDFAVQSTTCTTSLAAKSKCTMSVTFTPTATGTRTGQLNVSDSAANNPQTSNLTGTGK